MICWVLDGPRGHRRNLNIIKNQTQISPDVCQANCLDELGLWLVKACVTSTHTHIWHKITLRPFNLKPCSNVISNTNIIKHSLHVRILFRVTAYWHVLFLEEWMKHSSSDFSLLPWSMKNECLLSSPAVQLHIHYDDKVVTAWQFNKEQVVLTNPWHTPFLWIKTRCWFYSKRFISMCGFPAKFPLRSAT